MSRFSFFFLVLVVVVALTALITLIKMKTVNNILELMKRVLKAHFIDRQFLNEYMLRNIRRQICEAIMMQYDTKLASTTQF